MHHIPQLQQCVEDILAELVEWWYQNFKKNTFGISHYPTGV